MTGRWRRSLPAACWPARYPGQTRRESVEPGTVWLFAERFRAIMRAARPAASKLLNRAAAKVRASPLSLSLRLSLSGPGMEYLLFSRSELKSRAFIF